MSYLDRLLKEYSGKDVPRLLTELTEVPAPFVGSVSSLNERFSLRARPPTEQPLVGNHVSAALTEPTEASGSSVSIWKRHFARFDLSERAAIIEWDGSTSPVLAEALACMEALTPPWCDAARWNGIVDSFANMIHDGVAGQALAVGWKLVEIIGVQIREPHGFPLRAGLMFSLRHGERVSDVRPTHCKIIGHGVSHLWLRGPLPPPSVVLPWDLPEER